MKATETCRCGASCDVEDRFAFLAEHTLEAFREAHESCRGPKPGVLLVPEVIITAEGSTEEIAEAVARHMKPSTYGGPR